MTSSSPPATMTGSHAYLPLPLMFFSTKLHALAATPYAIFDIIRIHANVAFSIANSAWRSQILIDFQ